MTHDDPFIGSEKKVVWSSAAPEKLAPWRSAPAKLSLLRVELPLMLSLGANEKAADRLVLVVRLMSVPARDAPAMLEPLRAAPASEAPVKSASSSWLPGRFAWISTAPVKSQLL